MKKEMGIIFSTLFFCAVSHAQLQLNFNLTNQGSPGVTFPYGQTVELFKNEKPVYQTFSVESSYQLLSDTQIRFNFRHPLRVDLEENGKVLTALFRYVDVEVAPIEVHKLKEISESPPGTTFFASESNQISEAEILEAARSKGSILKMLEGGRQLPSILHFKKAIFLTHIPIADLKSGVPVKNSVKAQFQLVADYNPKKNLISVEKTDTLISLKNFDSKAMLVEDAVEYIEGIQKLRAVRRKIFNEGLHGSSNVVSGRFGSCLKVLPPKK